MRLVYDHQIFARQIYGGVSRYFWEVARRMSKREGYLVRVCAPLFINRYLEGDCGVTVLGRYVPSVRRTGWMVNGASGLLSKKCLSACRPDIVHETYFGRKRYAPWNSKTVVTVYDMIHEKFPEYFSPGDETARLKRASVKRASHVICISENTRRDLMEFVPLDPSRVSVVHLGVSMGEGETRGGTKLLDEPYILYVGERAGYKNFERTVTAYARSTWLRRDYSLVCVGGGEFSGQEMAMLSGLGLTERHVRQITVGDADLHSLYRDAAVLVYPSLYEEFGMPPLEAMANQCPVACSSTAVLHEVCGEAAAYFDPQDVESIAQVLEDVLYSTAERPSRVERGRQRASMFSWEKCAEETERVYSMVAGASR